MQRFQAPLLQPGGILSHQGDVLKHVDAMNEVDTTNVEPMAHAIDFVNVMREDKVYYEQTKEELMKNAPYEENGFFRVPKIN